jgi:UDP-2-acetamido-2,6-beta-L-arabino-hexul-4-ose reductase
MKVLVTGADGFIGKNLIFSLGEKGIQTVPFTRNNNKQDLISIVKDVDFIFHLAGVNRPLNPEEFNEGNVDLSKNLCDAISESKRKIPVVFSSSIQASEDSLYGKSKRSAEELFIKLEKNTGSPVFLYRLPNIFGKWSRPNYNSVVATFCFNILNDIPIQNNDPSIFIELLYIDDLISHFFKLLSKVPKGVVNDQILPTYSISLGDLENRIRLFKLSRKSLVIEQVGEGLNRALYATYLSFMIPKQFSYSLHEYPDLRGKFVEILKTRNSGQFSFFSINSFATRGGHYHHTKNEKFLVVSGTTRFRFRHIISDETYEIYISGDKLEVVESIPGWSHDISNIGNTEAFVFLWSNEIFDRQTPDTYKFEV